MKNIIKKELIILVILGSVLVVLFFDGNSADVDGKTVHAFEGLSEILNISDVTNEIIGQKDLITEFNKMREQKNITEFNVDDVIYLGAEKTTADRVSVFVKNKSDKLYKYNIYKQNSFYDSYQTYMAYHGCSACALTTLLNATVPELEKYTPDRIVAEVQKEVFGEDIFSKNFRKKMVSQMPVSMYGITKILDAYNINYEFTYDFSNEKAISEITEHLRTGNPVLITLRKKNGNTKWAGTVHTLLLIGLDEEGNAIVCDSANKKWAGKNQRVKFGNIEELVKYMWTSSELTESVYYKGRKGTSGYIRIY